MATEEAKKLIENGDIEGLAAWISGDDVDDVVDALRQDLMKISLSGLASGKWAPAAKLLAFGVAAGDDGLKQVAAHLDGLLKGLASSDENAQGFCAALIAKIVRKGHAKAVLDHPTALSTLVSVLENSTSDVDVDAACVGVLASLCDSAEPDTVSRVDSALGKKTFSTLLARSEPECVNGAFLLLSHVARLPQTRKNLVSDQELLSLVTAAFSSLELCGHAANAFRALALESRAVEFAKTNETAIASLAQNVAEDNFLSFSERVNIGLLLSQLSSSISISEKHQTSIWNLSKTSGVRSDDFDAIKLFADDVASISQAPSLLQAFVLWVVSLINSTSIVGDLKPYLSGSLDSLAASANFSAVVAAAKGALSK